MGEFNIRRGGILFVAGSGVFPNLRSYTKLVQRIHDQLYLLNVSGSRVLFAWIPGHCGIPDNESADQAAKEAVHDAPMQIPLVPASDLKSFLRKEI